MKKCMEVRVEGRRPVGIPRRTWLYNVEADMAEPEIDIEEMENNVMKKKSNTVGKRTINQ